MFSNSHVIRLVSHDYSIFLDYVLRLWGGWDGPERRQLPCQQQVDDFTCSSYRISLYVSVEHLFGFGGNLSQLWMESGGLNSLKGSDNALHLGSVGLGGKLKRAGKGWEVDGHRCKWRALIMVLDTCEYVASCTTEGDANTNVSSYHAHIYEDLLCLFMCMWPLLISMHCCVCTLRCR